MAESVVTENGEGGDATRRDFIHIAAGAAAVGAALAGATRPGCGEIGGSGDGAVK